MQTKAYARKILKCNNQRLSRIRRVDPHQPGGNGRKHGFRVQAVIAPHGAKQPFPFGFRQKKPFLYPFDQVRSAIRRIAGAQPLALQLEPFG